MHFPMANADNMNLDVYVKHKTINLFSKEKQFIYFISYLLHLNKAATIFLSNSGSNSYTNYIWNDGMYMYGAMLQIFYEDKNCRLPILPKLSNEHIKLMSYSKINIKLAAQILSLSVSKILTSYGPKDGGTAIMMLISWFWWCWYHDRT